jgi:hypothetical protein
VVVPIQAVPSEAGDVEVLETVSVHVGRAGSIAQPGRPDARPVRDVSNFPWPRFR